jgi:phage tail-like protein
MADLRRTDLDHVGGYNFTVEISGISAGFFKGVDGLNAEIEVIEFQDGDDLFLRKRPGRAKFGDVTLKKGYIVTADLQDWWRACRDGQYDRRDISIILNDNAANEIRRWNLYGCWPKEWKISGFDGKGADAATEEIVFVVEDMQIA